MFSKRSISSLFIIAAATAFIIVATLMILQGSDRCSSYNVPWWLIGLLVGSITSAISGVFGVLLAAKKKAYHVHDLVNVGLLIAMGVFVSAYLSFILGSRKHDDSPIKWSDYINHWPTVQNCLESRGFCSDKKNLYHGCCGGVGLGYSGGTHVGAVGPCYSCFACKTTMYMQQHERHQKFDNRSFLPAILGAFLGFIFGIVLLCIDRAMKPATTTPPPPTPGSVHIYNSGAIANATQGHGGGISTTTSAV